MPSEKTLRAAQNFLIAHIVTIRRRLDLAMYRNHVVSSGSEHVAWEQHHADIAYREIQAGLDWGKERETALRCWEYCQHNRIRILLLSDPEYPETLKAIHDPPPILFVRGNAIEELLARPMVAIVGSRRGDPRSCDFARFIAQELVRNGNVVVSGLALGIDGAAHAGAVTGGTLGTIAVLGSGVDEIYPRSHESLARRILDQGGALISPYVPGTPAYPAHFLERNRIVTGMSLATVIIQAMARSGALNSARYALEQGREVLSVPGPVRDPRFEGSNKLIKEGAAVLTESADLFDNIPGLHRVEAVQVSKEHENPSPIVRYLQEQGIVPYEQLLNHFAHDDALASSVLELELAGVVSRDPGDLVRLL